MARPQKTMKRPVSETTYTPLAKRAKGNSPNSSRPRTNGIPGQAATLNDSQPTVGMKVFVFGEGSAGELGLGPQNGMDVSRPRLNPSLIGVTSVATGGMHAAALTKDNKLLTWGQNDERALGRDTTWGGGLRNMSEGQDNDSEADDDGDLNPLEATPVPISMESLPRYCEIVQVVASDSATFILMRTGHVYGWGTFRDMSGVFGFTLDQAGEIVEIQDTPMLIPCLDKIKCLSVGADFTLALDHNGHVWAWGSGHQHQLGRRIIARRLKQILMPARVELPRRRKFVSIHTGSDHAFAIDTNGDTWAWGLNNFAQTGIVDHAGEEDASVVVPRKVPSLIGRSMKMIAGGRHHSIGLTSSGDCLVWGRMDGSQLGLDIANLPVNTKILSDDRGKPRALLEPTALPIPRCKYIAAGPDHCIAITEDGRGYSWGFNVNYQCGQGTSDDISVAKLMDGKALREVGLTWAGCGGQYSMLGSAELGSSKSRLSKKRT